MSIALSLDPAGNLFIPAAVLENTKWSKGAKVEVEVTSDGLFVRSQSNVQGWLEENEYGDLVLASNCRISDEDVIRAIAAEREERP